MEEQGQRRELLESSWELDPCFFWEGKREGKDNGKGTDED